MSLLSQRWAGLGRPAAGTRTLDARTWLIPSPLRSKHQARLNRAVYRPLVKAEASNNGASNPSVRLNSQGMVVSSNALLNVIFLAQNDVFFIFIYRP
jgi:hypothetical protein